jgi:hypothetical protein
VDDKASIFRPVASEAAQGAGITQFGRALSELNIDILCANSPQAKGRVERAHLTLQDRLVKELRLRGISTPEAGNAYWPEFLLNYNERFACEPRALTTLTDPSARTRTSISFSRGRRGPPTRHFYFGLTNMPAYCSYAPRAVRTHGGALSLSERLERAAAGRAEQGRASRERALGFVAQAINQVEMGIRFAE